MSLAYLDSSAIVKLYVSEPGSEQARNLLETVAAVAVSVVAYPEVRAAFARRSREGLFSTVDYQHIKQSFRLDWQRYFVLPTNQEIALAGGDLAEQYGLRGFDTLHLASALWLRGHQQRRIVFACWDRHLGRAAEQEGFHLIGARE